MKWTFCRFEHLSLCRKFSALNHSNISSPQIKGVQSSNNVVITLQQVKLEHQSNDFVTPCGVMILERPIKWYFQNTQHLFVCVVEDAPPCRPVSAGVGSLQESVSLLEQSVWDFTILILFLKLKIYYDKSLFILYADTFYVETYRIFQNNCLKDVINQPIEQ